jgi:hypothetical protein
MSQNRRHPNDRQTWAQANWDLIFIVIAIIALIALKSCSPAYAGGHDRAWPWTPASCLLPSAYSNACSSPSSGTDRSTPGGSFFEIPVRATCMSPLHESHGVLFSPLLTTDGRSTLLLPGPSADRRANNPQPTAETIFNRDRQDGQDFVDGGGAAGSVTGT